MKKPFFIVLVFFLGLVTLATPLSSARQQSISPKQSPVTEKQNAQPANNHNEASQESAPDAVKAAQKDKEEVVRISVTLVQVNAVVTDDKGRYVTNLQPDDFEISEDGKRQHITNFSYVAMQPMATPVNLAETGKPNKNAPPVPPMRLRPEQVRRTIALVVDDLGLSFESTAYLREALKKFVNEQVQPGDLVAIIRTGAGVGALQQFTTDKRVLNAAIERIHWNPSGRGGMTPFGQLGFFDSSGAQSGGVDSPRDSDSLERFREDVFAVGTMGALNYVVRGLRDLPGRKSVVLFSEGFRLINRDGTSDRVMAALRRLINLANRASVVFYTMDARGLQTLQLTAADDTSQMSQQDIQSALETRRETAFATQDGLNYLAQQTGGLFIRNTNDLNRGIRRVLDDQQGYYLLGYVPEASSFRAARGIAPFHKISVKVKRAGLHVRSRSGFYGFSDERLHPAQRTPGQQLIAALTSPFASGSIHLKLTSIFGQDLKDGAYVRSMLHIDPNELLFTKDAGGEQQAVLDVVAFTFGDNGQVIDRESREYTIHIPEAEFEKVRRQGLLYNLIVPIKKPGAYQLRIAVRDAGSEKLGSANQFIEVPDISKKRLALSGIIIEGADPAKQKHSASAPSVNTTEGAADEPDSQSGPALRTLRSGMLLNYGFVIYNATLTGAAGGPQLEAQLIVLRDGKAIYTGKSAPIEVPAGTDWRQIAAGGRLQLGDQMEPGDYVLQVVITDRQAKEKYNTATQWIDFEIVK